MLISNIGIRSSKIHKNDLIHLRGKISTTYFYTLVSMNDVEGIKIAPKIETEKLNPEKAGAIFYLIIYTAITANRST